MESHLHARVAVLECELRHARAQTQAAQQANQYILECLASYSSSPTMMLASPPSSPDERKSSPAISHQRQRSVEQRIARLEKVVAQSAGPRSLQKLPPTASDLGRCHTCKNSNIGPKCYDSSHEIGELIHLEHSNAEQTEQSTLGQCKTGVDRPALNALNRELPNPQQPQFIYHFQDRKDAKVTKESGMGSGGSQPFFNHPPAAAPPATGSDEDCFKNHSTAGVEIISKPEIWEKKQMTPDSALISAPTGPRNSHPKPNRFSGFGGGLLGVEYMPEEWFGAHGISYRPPEGYQNPFRTVLISNIPAGTTVSDILKQVGGGLIVSAKLVDTFAITKGLTAVISFFYGESASTFADHCKKHAIVFQGRTAKVAQLGTPTWPLQQRLIQAVLRHGHTRTLLVYNLPRYITLTALQRELCRSGSAESHGIESIEHAKFGITTLHFISIDDAGWAYAKLSTFRMFQGCGVCYGPDPCAKPLQDLSDTNGFIRPGATASSVNGPLAESGSSITLTYDDAEPKGDKEAISVHNPDEQIEGPQCAKLIVDSNKHIENSCQQAPPVMAESKKKGRRLSSGDSSEGRGAEEPGSKYDKQLPTRSVGFTQKHLQRPPQQPGLIRRRVDYSDLEYGNCPKTASVSRHASPIRNSEVAAKSSALDKPQGVSLQSEVTVSTSPGVWEDAIRPAGSSNAFNSTKLQQAAIGLCTNKLDFSSMSVAKPEVLIDISEPEEGESEDSSSDA